MTRFGERLHAKFSRGERLCVGIDPHTTILERWGLDDTPQGAEYLAKTVLEAVQDQPVACIKPQIALFERFGSQGFQALERVLHDARTAGVLTIADVKRGDIGSTFDAYAAAWLQPGSPLEADAMTVHAYHGPDALVGVRPFVETHGKGVFVLAATSNPEARKLQQARTGEGVSVAEYITHSMQQANTALGDPVGSYGVVLGATVTLSDYGISGAGQTMLPILAPGYGFQGAQIGQVHETFGSLSGGVLPSESRSVLGGGEAELVTRILERCEAIRKAFE